MNSAIAIGIGGMYIRVVLLTISDQTWWLTKLALLVTAEISIVIFVGCMPSFSRLYHHFRETGPSGKTTAVSKAGLVTFGGSDGNKKGSGKGKLSNTMARYMGSGGTGMTTLGSEDGYEHEDMVELRTHVTATAKAGGGVTPEPFTHMDDMESGGQVGVAVTNSERRPKSHLENQPSWPDLLHIVNR